MTKYCNKCGQCKSCQGGCVCVEDDNEGYFVGDMYDSYLGDGE